MVRQPWSDHGLTMVNHGQLHIQKSNDHYQVNHGQIPDAGIQINTDLWGMNMAEPWSTMVDHGQVISDNHGLTMVNHGQFHIQKSNDHQINDMWSNT